MSQVMNVGSEGRIISDVGLKHLRLQCAAEVGPVRFRAALEHFGSVDAVLSASRAELQRVGGIGPGVAESICTVRDDGSVDREVERAAAIGARIVCTEDADYPRSLLHISDPPICLYIRGHIEPADSVALAIVGTRRCSHYGREQSLRFGGLLGRAGITVVSGLARGVDGSAHRGALDAGGRTIAVLGNGLGEVYPPEHAELAEDVVRAGALVSELPVDTVPDSKNFPRRNRIIAGLSLGVLVVEAGKRSGALITARLASEYNREVFAVPGRVDQPAHTAGVHAMIRKGHAKLVTCLDDILDELDEVGAILRGEEDDAAASPTEPLPGVDRLGPDERAILKAVTAGAEDIESAAFSTGLNAGCVAGAVTSLQLKGFLERHPGNRLTCRRVRT